MTTPVRSEPAARPLRDARPRGVLCPFCGEVSPDVRQCRGCRAFLDPLSRQATQNEMGPWFIRDTSHPFRPGCSYQTISRLITRGKLGAMSVIRGPTTRQAWSFAGRTPSVANLLGVCHNCQREVARDAFSCPACGASFAAETDRQHLGLAPVHLLPGQASPEVIADSVTPPPHAAEPEPRGPAPAPIRQPPESSRAPQSPPEELAALRATMGRLRAGLIVVLVLALGLAGALGASLASVLRLPTPERAPASPAKSAPSVELEASTEAPRARESDAESAPREGPVETVPIDPEPTGAAPTEPLPDAPTGLRPEAMAVLARLIEAGDPEPDAIREAVLGGGGTEEDVRAWLSAAARRRELTRLRALP